jgi:threonylcarbamoyladenosine tRNA methylthiotransferase MtaB
VRIRLSSIEPADFSDSLLDVIEQYTTICPHIHLPLQHASPAILERMNRGYTIEEYSDIVERIFTRIPDAAISTDIIVGFPGETEKDFQFLYDFVRTSPFFRLHVFKYSPRKGTKAASFSGKVDDSQKQRRSSLLIQKGLEKSRDYSSRFIGSTREVLVEGREKDILYGLTPQYLKVRFKGDASLSGSLVTIHIDGHDVEAGTLKGTLT